MAPTSGVVWEWEGDDGTWNAFSEEHCKLLCEGLMNGDSTVPIQVSQTVKMNIRFDAMTQTNTRTGWQRNIRCVPSVSSTPSSGTHSVWEWENDVGEWTSFSPVNQRLLHACKLCNVEAVSVEIMPRKQSKVDLKSMKHEMTDGKRLGIRCNPLAGEL